MKFIGILCLKCYTRIKITKTKYSSCSRTFYDGRSCRDLFLSCALYSHVLLPLSLSLSHARPNRVFVSETIEGKKKSVHLWRTHKQAVRHRGRLLRAHDPSLCAGLLDEVPFFTYVIWFLPLVNRMMVLRRRWPSRPWQLMAPRACSVLNFRPWFKRHFTPSRGERIHKKENRNSCTWAYIYIRTDTLYLMKYINILPSMSLVVLYNISKVT